MHLKAMEVHLMYIHQACILNTIRQCDRCVLLEHKLIATSMHFISAKISHLMSKT